MSVTPKLRTIVTKLAGSDVLLRVRDGRLEFACNPPIRYPNGEECWLDVVKYQMSWLALNLVKDIQRELSENPLESKYRWVGDQLVLNENEEILAEISTNNRWCNAMSSEADSFTIRINSHGDGIEVQANGRRFMTKDAARAEVNRLYKTGL